MPAALTTLIATAQDDKSTKVRSQALFWLAQKAGKEALAVITNAIDNDPETEVKKKAVFALSQLPKDEGVPKLMEVARNNRNPEVRKQAMFWLGQTQRPARGEILRGHPPEEIEIAAAWAIAMQLIEIIANELAAAIARRDVGARARPPGEGVRAAARPAETRSTTDAFLDGIAKIPGEILFVKVEQLTVDLSGDGAIVTGIQQAQLKIDGAVVDRSPLVRRLVREGGRRVALRVAVDHGDGGRAPVRRQATRHGDTELHASPAACGAASETSNERDVCADTVVGRQPAVRRVDSVRARRPACLCG